MRVCALRRRRWLALQDRVAVLSQVRPRRCCCAPFEWLNYVLQSLRAHGPVSGSNHLQRPGKRPSGPGVVGAGSVSLPGTNDCIPPRRAAAAEGRARRGAARHLVGEQHHRAVRLETWTQRFDGARNVTEVLVATTKMPMGPTPALRHPRPSC